MAAGQPSLLALGDYPFVPPTARALTVHIRLQEMTLRDFQRFMVQDRPAFLIALKTTNPAEA